MPDRTLPDGRFTFRLIVGMFLVSCLVFGGLIWHVFHSYRVTRQIIRQEMRLKEFAWEIVYLDEALTMSARIAVLTLEPEWMERYYRFEQQFDEVIEEAQKLVPEVRHNQAVLQAAGTNDKLVAMEHKAIKEVEEGRFEEAQEILFGGAYGIQKEIYADAVKRFSDQLRIRAEEILSGEHDRAVFSIAVISVLIPLLFFAWTAVLFVLRRWQLAVQENSRLAERRLMEKEAAKEALEMDISERKKAEEALRESQTRLQLVAHATNDAVWDWDFRTNQVWWNDGICAIFGYQPSEVISDSAWWKDHIHSGDRDQVTSGVHAAIEGRGEFWSAEYRFRRADNTYAYVYNRGYVVRESSGKAIRMIGAIVDISDRKQVEEQLLHDAFHDLVTGLPNRALFIDRLGRSIGRAKRRSDYLFAVLFIDVDRFKVINDSLGHAVGDQLLKTITERLLSSLRPSDTLARFGGDKFTVLLEDIGDVNDATRVADRIQKELTVPFNLGKQEVFITVSIGISQSATGYDQPEDFLRDAETAMYRAKTLGRARYQVFDTEMHARAVSLLQMETDLRRAIERNEFEVYYQPIISLKTGLLSGFESLVRWRHPQRGILLPYDFLPILQEMGLIIQLDHHVLMESCRQMKEWQKKFPACSSVNMNVNLSAKHFAHPGFSDFVDQVLQETGLNPKTLKLEIPESGIMEHAEFVEVALVQLKAKKVSLSIDDFGTGNSSLSAIHRFPIETLKIDRSFVSMMDQKQENLEIVRAIIVLAHNLSMDVVAEGIETEPQLVLLRDLGCEYGQGFLFSKPVPSKTAEGFLSPSPKQFIAKTKASNSRIA